MGERSDEVAMDNLSTVHPGDKTSSIKKSRRQLNKDGDIPCEETSGGAESVYHPPAQGRTEQTDRLAVKRTVDSRFACTECGYRAASRSNLLVHARKHTESVKRSGEVAMDDLPTAHAGDERSGIKKSYSGRQQNNDGGIPPEETCGVESDHPPAQRRTEQTDRLAVKRTVDRRFECTECDYTAAKKYCLVIHTRIHTGEKPYKCGQCDYCARQKSSLDLHRTTKHSGEKPLMCDECEYRTADRSNLSVHMRLHTGDKPFKCGQCDYSTARKGNLDRHMAKHTGEKPYSCGDCGYSTADRSSLTVHLRKHTGEKPYKCDQCDYSAAKKDNLDRHMATHTAEKPYMCGGCGYRTSNRSHLNRHVSRHASVKPYKCDKCDFSTKWKNYLKKHSLKHTS